MKTICAALLLVALSLGGCCLSSSGCNAPQPTALTNWDDELDQLPEEAAVPAARKQHVDKRAKAQKAKSASESANSANSWQDEENQRAADDARLKLKLMICQNCAVTEETDVVGQRTYVLADGSKTQSDTFTIRSLKVGDIIIENVTASVAPSQGALLLGQSFLQRFKSWSIDNATGELLLETR